ncbi:tripartite tricarboxylate transporter substrate-binding protein [Hydrogenophaga sp. UC242_50]|uniref:tripartite tricarboxylate transporter substrate-binding protein n=1 Tax=unclassified Hydrogenophaga TaxID=2610897 RepID=UPI0036D3CCAB
MPGYEVSAWYGLFAPAGTPPAIVQRLQAEVVSALKDPALLQRLSALGAEPAGSTPEELSRFVRSEYDKWGKVVRQAGIRLD